MWDGLEPDKMRDNIISAGAKMQGDNVIVAPLEKLEQSRPQQPADTKIEKTTVTENETK